MARDSKMVIGSYKNPEDVRAALQRLRREGYDREDITLYTDPSNLDRIEDTEYIETWTEEANRADDEHRTDRSFWERVKDMVSYDDPDDERVDDEEAEFIAPYREDIQNGYTVIAVDNYIGDSGKEIETQQMDVDEDSDAAATVPRDRQEPADRMDSSDTVEEDNIQLKEEEVNIEKEEVQTGEVEVRKETVEDVETIEVPVKREQIVVERKSVEDTTKDPDDTRDDEDSESITIPVKEEKIIVEKEPVVKEEVKIKKERKKDTEHITEDVKREELDIDATGRTGRKNTSRTDDDIDDRRRRR